MHNFDPVVRFKLCKIVHSSSLVLTLAQDFAQTLAQTLAKSLPEPKPKP